MRCDAQEEVDYYWEKLTVGGSESQCGWLKDKFGLSWQIVPARLPDLIKKTEGDAGHASDEETRHRGTRARSEIVEQSAARIRHRHRNRVLVGQVGSRRGEFGRRAASGAEPREREGDGRYEVWRHIVFHHGLQPGEQVVPRIELGRRSGERRQTLEIRAEVHEVARSLQSVPDQRGVVAGLWELCVQIGQSRCVIP